MDPYVLMLQTDADDKYIAESTFEEIGNKVPVRFIANIDEMAGLVAEAGNPSIILLSDRGATHQDNEILRQLKSSGPYSHIPVVVLGEFSTKEYINECYKAGANTFIIKPSSVAGTRKKIEGFFEYWFGVAELGEV